MAGIHGVRSIGPDCLQLSQYNNFADVTLADEGINSMMMPIPSKAQFQAKHETVHIG